MIENERPKIEQQPQIKENKIKDEIEPKIEELIEEEVPPLEQTEPLDPKDGSTIDLRTESQNQKSSWRRCSITAKQMEEIFDKRPMEFRKDISEWAKLNRSCNSEFFLVPKIEGAEGRPEKWKLLCIDTQRFQNFRWREISFLCVPPRENKDELFNLAMKILDRNSIGLNLCLGRYEKTEKAHVISLNVPTILFDEFIEVQKLQDEIERKEKKSLEKDQNEKTETSESKMESSSQELKKRQSEVKRKIIECKEMDEDQFRHFALSLFQIRAEQDPPLILVHSQVDFQLRVLWFRDFSLINENFHLKILPGVQHLYWPNYSHMPSTNPPIYCCEKSDCKNWGGFVKENKDGILDTFIDHVGELEKEINNQVKRKKIEIWKKEYSDLLDSFVNEKRGTSEEAINHYENLLNEREPQIKQLIISQTLSKMSRCSRCKKVRYCCQQCQKSDWERHKNVCFV